MRDDLLEYAGKGGTAPSTTRTLFSRSKYLNKDSRVSTALTGPCVDNRGLQGRHRQPLKLFRQEGKQPGSNPGLLLRALLPGLAVAPMWPHCGLLWILRVDSKNDRQVQIVDTKTMHGHL
jgi:hypothetical protein